MYQAGFREFETKFPFSWLLKKEIDALISASVDIRADFNAGKMLNFLK